MWDNRRGSRSVAKSANRGGAKRLKLQRSMLDWYDAGRRDLPWRAAPGQQADPYHVWLSEIMLQQTTVATVGPYFHNFLDRWPDIHALAAAPLDDVLHGWQGLGYYARARNLHRCAGVVVADHGGKFPADEALLLKLPGIGPYTAGAIAAIAFGLPTTAVDGNVERVIARLHGLETPLPAVKPEITELAREIAPTERSGDYLQAVMDLGATTCTPRAPSCDRCPWAEFCVAHAAGNAESLPRKSPKPERPTRRGVAFWALTEAGETLLRRRPEKGLLGGMMEIPSTDWREISWGRDDALPHAPFKANWKELDGVVKHTFTHFHLELTVMTARASDMSAEGVWVAIDNLGDHALPTVMKKIVKHALDGG
jgi:A/G-specific adenine glycosylase